MEDIANLGGVVVHKIAISNNGYIGILSNTANVAVIKSGIAKYFGQGMRPFEIDFLTRDGKEFLVAVYGFEGKVALWDVEQGESQVVFQMTEKTSKVFSVIDEKTVGLCEHKPDPQGNFIVHILSTEGSQWVVKE